MSSLSALLMGWQDFVQVGNQVGTKTFYSSVPWQTNALLFTIWNYVYEHFLRTIFFDIFDPHISSYMVAQFNCCKKNWYLTKNTLRWIINFQARDSHSAPLFKNPTAFWNLKTKYCTFIIYKEKRGGWGGVLKFVTCLQILLLLSNRYINYFADCWGRGSKNL